MNAPTLMAMMARTPTTQPAAIAALLTPLPLSLGVADGELEVSGAAEAVTTTVLGLDGSAILHQYRFPLSHERTRTCIDKSCFTCRGST
jgi:hypothetical protein